MSKTAWFGRPDIADQDVDFASVLPVRARLRLLGTLLMPTLAQMDA
jgi:hypothetical protein